MALEKKQKTVSEGLCWGARRWSGCDARGLGLFKSPACSKPPARTNSTSEMLLGHSCTSTGLEGVTLKRTARQYSHMISYPAVDYIL